MAVSESLEPCSRVVVVTSHWGTEPLEPDVVRMIVGSLTLDADVEVWSLLGPGRSGEPDGAVVVTDLAGLPQNEQVWHLLVTLLRGAGAAQPSPIREWVERRDETSDEEGMFRRLGRGGPVGLSDDAFAGLAGSLANAWRTARDRLEDGPPSLVLLVGDPTAGVSAVEPLLTELVRDAIKTAEARVAMPLIGGSPIPDWCRSLSREIETFWALSPREAERLAAFENAVTVEVGGFLSVNSFVLAEPFHELAGKPYAVFADGEFGPGILFEGMLELAQFGDAEELREGAEWLSAGLPDLRVVMLGGSGEVEILQQGRARPLPPVGNRADVQRLLAHASCVVIGRSGTVVGRTALESQRLGVPVVAPTGSLEASHLERSLGGIVTWWRGEELEACRWVMEQPELARKLGAAGSSWAKDHWGDVTAFKARLSAAVGEALVQARHRSGG
ncbi:hypothetical protein [Aciditerrimonas ferrireducens]|uniref:hypothetical protein n=1 Tax=Aciditerrimonas ferrireducens TaxID=667306 RepID=UPI00200526AA|nr:hypothetical protein [Aciditerrimonas ferrireducens]